MENKVAYEINDFIGIFHNVIPKNICDKIVNHYEQVQSMGMTVNRQELEQTRLIDKDTDTYRLSSSPMSLEAPNEIVSSMDMYFVEEFKKAFWPCYHEYTKQYGILESIGKHGFRSAFKIQKTKPSSGYHVWHCEHGSENTSSRLLLVIVYLNDVEDGGETEFLYQRKRVKPTKGTMIIVPGAFTHTHRGNPPLTGDKYIMNTWLHFLE
jgi:hypothetical protein